MRIQRRILRLTCGTMLAVLSACGGAPEAPSSETSSNLDTIDPTGQKIVFWYQHTRQREEGLQELISQFNQSNEYGIHVRGEYAGDYGDIYNKMMVGLQGGEVPDLLVAYQNQARAYADADGVVDLVPYLTSPKWGLSNEARADFVHAFMQQDQIDGQQFGLPPNRSIEILYYNADWLEEIGAHEPPTTWEAFAQLCRKARDQPFSGNADSTRSLGFIYEEDASRLASMVFSRGGDFMTADGGAYTLDTPQVRASLSLMKQLIEDKAAEMMGEPYGDQREFAAGQCLFILRSSSGLPYVQSAIDAGPGFDWKVAAPPRTVSKPVVNFYGASVSVGVTSPERQLAAWIFLKWFTEPAQQAHWVKASNYFPARKSTGELLTTYIQDNPRYGIVYELLEFGKPEPSVSGYEPVRRLVAQAVIKVMQGGDMDAALAQLQAEASATLEDY
ncbi:MAG: ABC transporter substrate-binding protein [Candidatus Latescibacteria bacterium]|nr:ABC transporter substrate-binding protein [Candidatus Latescibacterota bacterium]